MNVREAIEAGDTRNLRALLDEDPSRANELIVWGKHCEIRTHPFHFISDMLFDGTLEKGKEIAMAQILLEAGADCNHQAANGETPLIGAASLGAEDLGVYLLEAGASHASKGGFEETALHWAAHLGLSQLVERLIAFGADVNMTDARYNSSPLGWAIHGRSTSPAGSAGQYPAVVTMLVSAGAQS